MINETNFVECVLQTFSQTDFVNSVRNRFYRDEGPSCRGRLSVAPSWRRTMIAFETGNRPNQVVVNIPQFGKLGYPVHSRAKSCMLDFTYH